MKFVGFNTKTFVNFFATVDEKSDASDWYFKGKIIFRKNNFKEIKRSKNGSGVSLLNKIKEYIGINCYIPSDGCCFVKCVNYVLNKDYTREFQDFINSFQKSNRKGVMTSARICEFNKKFNTNFQIYMPKHRLFQPKKVTEELDWVFYLHKEHFCLIRRNNKALDIKEIEDNYDENVWRTCEDDNAATQVSLLKLNVFPTIPDYCLYAWDCKTYCEKETNKAIPYCCTLVNLEKLRKRLDDYNNYLRDLSDFNETLDFKPSDPISEEFYNKLMTNIVEIFVGTDCIDQMLQRLGKKKWKRQNINFTCSYQHESSSLAAWGKSSNLPMNLRKIEDVNIAKYIKDNWESLRHEWEPYAKRDTLCLGACLIKYNQAMKKTVFQNVSNNLTAPSLSLKDKVLKEEEFRQIEKQNVEKVYSHTHPFIRYFIRQSIKGGRVSANRKSFETNKMDEICAILKEYNESDTEGIIDLFKEYSVNPKDKTEVHTKLKELNYSKLMAFDANGLYASAMTEAKDKITFTNRIGQKETGTKIRFRNGFCHDVLTSVDIQEIVKSGGKIIRILDGRVYKENFKTPPYRDYILILKELRNKYKKEGDMVASNCMKLLGNSLYGKSIQKDINTSRHLWSEATFKANFDSHVKSYEKVNDSQYIVEMNEEEKEFVPPKDFTRLTPTHLGAFILSHSKKIMNNFIHVIDGFYKPEIYYTDTDSLYISSSKWDKLNEAGLVSENEYSKGKNDYGDGGIIFGLYLAPKVKYNIILTSDGV
ncbi:hypothetical protein LOTGIDRAFT_157165 [Lottia gigantea]|uniref:DNA-directed DNA polymerase n=1 Tax=Lottia gigantea TaxID=225164 RepID=V4CIM9_LOTGI|nr:hypothetical protein LOTGIDRAFT_157165 [Lottia gigantea]ESP02035.1 hypothetical protein LOTGIDRAFT_157165 [Lottia gigantea]